MGEGGGGGEKGEEQRGETWEIGFFSWNNPANVRFYYGSETKSIESKLRWGIGSTVETLQSIGERPSLMNQNDRQQSFGAARAAGCGRVGSSLTFRCCCVPVQRVGNHLGIQRKRSGLGKFRPCLPSLPPSFPPPPSIPLDINCWRNPILATSHFNISAFVCWLVP